ncbi:hypothetical protein V8J82_02820 [Gymnodinialimonas sp. 2305UL16-5]|uniref:hypothetical protein n=1 Tax=Gymnodinialimonas mytili TaxID=3126503 RepID=UPI0030AE3707
MSTQQSHPKEAAADITAKAKADAASAAESIKDTVADRTAEQAANIREAGAAFDDSPYARQAAEQISDSLSHVAASLREADLGSIQRDVTEFARRNPLLFFGGAAALGFVAGRAMKASERAEPPAQDIPEPNHAHPASNRWGYV